MSTIAISDLCPVGSDLFFDSESYMKYLSDEELSIQGGASPSASTTIATSSPACMSIGLVVSIVGTIAYTVLR